MALPDIVNFVPVDDHIATGGQPSEEQLAEIAAAGYQGVINLGLPDPRYCLPDEAATVRSLGMLYLHIPVDFGRPELEAYRSFVRAMDQAAGRRLFIHCALNYRVSAFVGLYGQLRWEWTQWRAEEFIRGMWEPDPVWSAFLEQARSLSLPKEKPPRQATRAPSPKPDASPAPAPPPAAPAPTRPAPQPPAPRAAPEEDLPPAECVRLFFEQVLEQDNRRLLAFLVGEGVRFRTALSGEGRGREELARALARLRSATAELRYDVRESIGEGDRVFVRSLASARHSGELLGFPPSGKAIGWEMASVFRFEAGRIAELWELGDVHGLLQQLAANLE